MNDKTIFALPKNLYNLRSQEAAVGESMIGCYTTCKLIGETNVMIGDTNINST